jgi:Protein of unknown function (DUF3667)
MICKNCGNGFEGNFCNNCGQKAVVNRFTLKHAFHDFLHSFTHIDRGILFLIKELFLRPGIVAKEYIEGKRKKYFNPYQYLLITVAVATFLSVNYHLMGPKADANVLGSGVQNFGLQYNAFIYKYFNLMQLFSVPLLAFFSWLFYKRSGYNYAENLVLNTFLGAQRTLIYILLAPFLYFFSHHWYITIGIYYAGWLVYYGWAFVQFFQQKKSAVIIKYIIMTILMVPLIQLMSLGIFYLFFFNK